MMQVKTDGQEASGLESAAIEAQEASGVESAGTETQGRSGVDRVAMEASSVGEAEVPSRILIAPWGEVKSSSGSFVVDEEALRETIAAFEAHGIDLPVDYEHQTLGGAYSSPNGQAPAAGWIKALSVVRPDDSQAVPGLWATVEWTAEATERLRSRQYRYLSPVALVRRRDRRLVGIHSVALTNKPAIVGMLPVVHRNVPVSSDVAGATSVTAALRGALSMDDSVAEEAVLVAAVERIRTLEETERLRRATDRVSKAMSAGKLTAAQRDWALSLAQRDPEEFDRWERAAPVVVVLGRLSPPETGTAGTAERRRSVELAARAEWRAHRGLLEKLCTEEAFVADALREDSR